MEDLDFWKECIGIAADECDLQLTNEQLTCLAESASAGHENYGMAFTILPIPTDTTTLSESGRKNIKTLRER